MLEILLSEADRNRLAELLLVIQEEQKLNNAQLSRILNCAPSSVGYFLQGRTKKIHKDKIEKLANLLRISFDNVIELIQHDSGWPLESRIVQMQSCLPDEEREVESPSPLGVVFKKMQNLPIDDLPKVIECATARLSAAVLDCDNSLGVFMNKKEFLPISLSREDRILISRLVFFSINTRKTMGCFSNDIFDRQSLLTSFILAQGRDIFEELEDGILSINEEGLDELEEIAHFCLKVDWKKGIPHLRYPLEFFKSWDQLIDELRRNNGVSSDL